MCFDTLATNYKYLVVRGMYYAVISTGNDKVAKFSNLGGGLTNFDLNHSFSV